VEPPRNAGACEVPNGSWGATDWQIEQSPIIGAGEGGVELGAELGLRNLSLRDTRQHDGTGEDFAARVVLAGAELVIAVRLQAGRGRGAAEPDSRIQIVHFVSSPLIRLCGLHGK
jgi:hypothetical protein